MSVESGVSPLKPLLATPGPSVDNQESSECEAGLARSTRKGRGVNKKRQSGQFVKSTKVDPGPVKGGRGGVTPPAVAGSGRGRGGRGGGGRGRGRGVVVAGRGQGGSKKSNGGSGVAGNADVSADEGDGDQEEEMEEEEDDGDGEYEDEVVFENDEGMVDDEDGEDDEVTMSKPRAEKGPHIDPTTPRGAVIEGFKNLTVPEMTEISSTLDKLIANITSDQAPDAAEAAFREVIETAVCLFARVTHAGKAAFLVGARARFRCLSPTAVATFTSQKAVYILLGHVAVHGEEANHLTADVNGSTAALVRLLQAALLSVDALFFVLNLGIEDDWHDDRTPWGRKARSGIQAAERNVLLAIMGLMVAALKQRGGRVLHISHMLHSRLTTTNGHILVFPLNVCAKLVKSALTAFTVYSTKAGRETIRIKGGHHLSTATLAVDNWKKAAHPLQIVLLAAEAVGLSPESAERRSTVDLVLFMARAASIPPATETVMADAEPASQPSRSETLLELARAGFVDAAAIAASEGNFEIAGRVVTEAGLAVLERLLPDVDILIEEAWDYIEASADPVTEPYTEGMLMGFRQFRYQLAGFRELKEMLETLHGNSPKDDPPNSKETPRQHFIDYKTAVASGKPERRHITHSVNYLHCIRNVATGQLSHFYAGSSAAGLEARGADRNRDYASLQAGVTVRTDTFTRDLALIKNKSDFIVETRYNTCTYRAPPPLITNGFVAMLLQEEELIHLVKQRRTGINILLRPLQCGKGTINSGESLAISRRTGLELRHHLIHQRSSNAVRTLEMKKLEARMISGGKSKMEATATAFKWFDEALANDECAAVSFEAVAGKASLVRDSITDCFGVLQLSHDQFIPYLTLRNETNFVLGKAVTKEAAAAMHDEAAAECGVSSKMLNDPGQSIVINPKRLPGTVSASGWIGVHRKKNRKNWSVSIRVDGKRIHGERVYSNGEDAAREYDRLVNISFYTI